MRLFVGVATPKCVGLAPGYCGRGTVEMSGSAGEVCGGSGRQYGARWTMASFLGACSERGARVLRSGLGVFSCDLPTTRGVGGVRIRPGTPRRDRSSVPDRTLCRIAAHLVPDCGIGGTGVNANRIGRAEVRGSAGRSGTSAGRVWDSNGRVWDSNIKCGSSNGYGYVFMPVFVITEVGFTRFEVRNGRK